MVCDAVYCNPFDNFKQWYTPYINKNKGTAVVRLNTGILNTVKVKPIKNVDITDRSSNNLRGEKSG